MMKESQDVKGAGYQENKRITYDAKWEKCQKQVLVVAPCSRKIERSGAYSPMSA